MQAYQAVSQPMISMQRSGSKTGASRSPGIDTETKSVPTKARGQMCREQRFSPERCADQCQLSCSTGSNSVTCSFCSTNEEPETMLQCSSCSRRYHPECLHPKPPADTQSWLCPDCQTIRAPVSSPSADAKGSMTDSAQRKRPRSRVLEANPIQPSPKQQDTPQTSKRKKSAAPNQASTFVSSTKITAAQCACNASDADLKYVSCLPESVIGNELAQDQLAGVIRTAENFVAANANASVSDIPHTGTSVDRSRFSKTTSL